MAYANEKDKNSYWTKMWSSYTKYSKMAIIIETQKWAKADEAATRSMHYLVAHLAAVAATRVRIPASCQILYIPKDKTLDGV